MFKLVKALGHSLQGLYYAIQEENPVRLELIIFVMLIGLSFVLTISLLEKILLISVWAVVLIVELLNSAIERLSNEITQESKINIKRAKDYGSASVLVAILIALSVWFAVLYKYFFA